MQLDDKVREILASCHIAAEHINAIIEKEKVINQLFSFDFDADFGTYPESVFKVIEMSVLATAIEYMRKVEPATSVIIDALENLKL